MTNSTIPAPKNTFKSVKGVSLTPPIIGRITLGHVEMIGRGQEAKEVSFSDDSFNITTLVQNKEDRSWEPHPILEKIKAPDEKLRAIPVVIAYNDPGLNVTNSYTAFDPASGRAVCTGDGETAQRIVETEVTSLQCPGPEACEWGAKNKCKSFTRANFRIEGQDDELGNFILRTTSWNSLDRLAARFCELHALTGGCIAGMPMSLVMVDKTSRKSFGDTFQFVDLVTRPGSSLIQAIKTAKEFQESYEAADLDLEALEECLRQGLARPRLSEHIEDFEEFLSDDELLGIVQAKATAGPGGLRGLTMVSEQLREKLTTKNVVPIVNDSTTDLDNHDLLALEALGR